MKFPELVNVIEPNHLFNQNVTERKITTKEFDDNLKIFINQFESAEIGEIVLN